MYLPTGTPHAARAQDEASLHVTVDAYRIDDRYVTIETEGRVVRMLYDRAGSHARPLAGRLERAPIHHDRPAGAAPRPAGPGA